MRRIGNGIPESEPAPDSRDDLDPGWASIRAFAVAEELIETLDAQGGWMGEGGLQVYRSTYHRFDDEEARIFRARLTVYLAKLFSTRHRRAFPLAAAIVDAWFPPRPAAR